MEAGEAEEKEVIEASAKAEGQKQLSVGELGIPAAAIPDLAENDTHSSASVVLQGVNESRNQIEVEDLGRWTFDGSAIKGSWDWSTRARAGLLAVILLVIWVARGEKSGAERERVSNGSESEK